MYRISGFFSRESGSLPCSVHDDDQLIFFLSCLTNFELEKIDSNEIVKKRYKMKEKEKFFLFGPEITTKK